MQTNNEQTSETEQKICDHCLQPLDDSLFYCPHCGCRNPYYQAKVQNEIEPVSSATDDPGFPLMVILSTPCLLFFPLAGIPLLITGTILEFSNKQIAKRYRIRTLIFSIILLVATLILLIQTVMEMTKKIY